jgi:hypothetical protein
MSEPFIFINSFEIKEGKLEDLRQFLGAITSIQVYGTPNDVILKRARLHARSGVSVTVKPSTSADSPASRQPRRLESRRTGQGKGSDVSDRPADSTIDRRRKQREQRTVCVP